MNAATRTYVGIGSNLDGPIEQVRAAVEALQRLPDSRLVRCSSLYRTAPVGVAAQPDFINAVCALDTGLTPERLLGELLAIEQRQGRRRQHAGAPRTLDLDLLLYGDRRSDTAELTLPHPRLHERRFVLYPLCEIAPALQVPARGAVAELLAACPPQAVLRLSETPVTRESIT